MSEQKPKNHKRKIIVTVIAVSVFAYYIAVGIIMSYMQGVSMLAKIFALVLPALLTGIAATMLAINISEVAKSHKKNENNESGDDNADND